ncbi:MAG: DNA topoisomerase VI subunit B, partial [Candidatus Kariarchaeaceae archaeon]
MTESDKPVKAEVTQQASPARFFNDNRAIAGFGNSTRAVFTSVRELVENGLDAAETRGIAPVMDIKLMKLSQEEISALLDVKGFEAKRGEDFLRLSCKDNGIGVEHSQIPFLFGRVLTGSKYGARQTRGRFGLGAKMCLLYSMSTLHLPIEIKSRHFLSEDTSVYNLMIDLEENQPIILLEEVLTPDHPDAFDGPGTEITVSFTGAWNRAKSHVKEYFHQLAIITPYANIKVELPPEDEEDEIDIFSFESVIDDLPKSPEEAKIHPYGCDITYFNGELATTTEDTLAKFLCEQFEGVNLKIAEGFFNELNIDPDKHPNELSVKEIRRIVVDGFQRAFAESKEMTRKRDRVFKFEDPRGDVLSPLGANRLRKGLEKELNPTFVEAITRAPRAYSGHPFIIEAALGYGGKVSSEAAQKAVSDNKIIYRYANRIPLIFSSSNDVIYQAVQEIKWSDYGLTRQSDPLAIAVSLVSTKIPFPETSKEYISNVSEIAEEVQLALLQLGRRLKTFLTKAKRSRRERARQSRFNRYAPDTMDSVMKILVKENILAADFSKISPQVITALSSGDKKLVRSRLPKGSSIASANVWLPESLKEKLIKKKIITVGEFLKEESPDLATLLQISEERINKIKRQTIINLDDHNISPEIDAEFYVNKEVEKNFHIRDGKREALRFHLSRAFPRRWILTPFDYINNSINVLRRVEGLDAKLLERKKEEIRLSIKIEEEDPLEAIEDPSKEQAIDLESLSESDLSQDEEFQTLIDQIITDEASGKDDSEELEKALKHELASSEETISMEEEKQLFKIDKDGKPIYSLSQIFPTFSQVQDEVSGYLSRKKIENVEDLLADLKRPLIPPPPKQIVEYIIKHIQSVYAQISETHPSFLVQKITRMSPDWTDGVTKNFFHRRSIESVQDFIDNSAEELSEILQISRNLIDVFCTSLAETEESPSLELLFEGVSKKTHQEINRVLKREKVDTVAQFLNIDTYATVSSSKYDIFINALILESKFLTVKNLDEQGFGLPLEFLKEIDSDLIFELNKLKVMSTTEFLTCSNDTLKEINHLSEEKIIQIKEILGTPLPDWFSKKLKKWFIGNGIVSLEQVITGKMLTSQDNKLNEEIAKIEKVLHAPVIFAGEKVVGYADH